MAQEYIRAKAVRKIWMKFLQEEDFGNEREIFLRFSSSHVSRARATKRIRSNKHTDTHKHRHIRPALSHTHSLSFTHIHETYNTRATPPSQANIALFINARGSGSLSVSNFFQAKIVDEIANHKVFR